MINWKLEMFLIYIFTKYDFFKGFGCISLQVERGYFWIRKAAAKGHAEAITFLKKSALDTATSEDDDEL